jgi:thioredoxin reductase (NADPH)
MVRPRRGIYDLLVIGGGMTGLTAACHAARCGVGVALLEALPLFGGQIANVEEVEGYPAAGAVSGIALAVDLIEKCRALGVEFLEGEADALSIESGVHAVSAGGATHRAKSVIVASGARLKPLGVPGEAAFLGRGVSQCASCDGPLFQGEDVAVIGGGDAAVQEALVLAGFCRSVTLVCRSAMRAKRDMVDRLTGRDNVTFVWDSVVEEIAGRDVVERLKLRSLTDGSTSELACAGVFPFIGVAPNSGFLPEDVRREDDYVVTDDSLRTSVPGVFAAGAVRRGYGGHLAEAAGEAVSAARAAAAFLRQDTT